MMTNLDKIKNFALPQMCDFIYNMLNNGSERCIKCPLYGICETKYSEYSSCKGKIMKWLTDKNVPTNFDIIKEFEVSGIKPFDNCENTSDMVKMFKSNIRCEICWMFDECDATLVSCDYMLEQWLLREADIKNEK